MTDKNPKIFILDDDQFLLNMYSMKFQKSGFEVETAPSSELALEKLRGDFLPDVLLVDVVMPVMDGFDFLEVVREEKLAKDSAVIILTNQDQERVLEAERVRKLNVDGYIVKASAIPSEVVEEVRRVLNRKRGRGV